MVRRRESHITSGIARRPGGEADGPRGNLGDEEVQVGVERRLEVILGLEGPAAGTEERPQGHLIWVPVLQAPPPRSVQAEDQPQEQGQRETWIDAQGVSRRTHESHATVRHHVATPAARRAGAGPGVCGAARSGARSDRGPARARALAGVRAEADARGDQPARRTRRRRLRDRGAGRLAGRPRRVRARDPARSRAGRGHRAADREPRPRGGTRGSRRGTAPASTSRTSSSRTWSRCASCSSRKSAGRAGRSSTASPWAATSSWRRSSSGRDSTRVAWPNAAWSTASASRTTCWRTPPRPS